VLREAAGILAMPNLTEPLRLVVVPGVRALAWLEAGELPAAAPAARAAERDARRLKFDQHFFALDYLRGLAGLALERNDLDTAERLTEQVLRIAERRRPFAEFLAMLDRARIWQARGQAREALATVAAARQVMPDSGSTLAQADAVEAAIRISAGDVRTAAGLAGRLSSPRRELLAAQAALASGEHDAVVRLLEPLDGLAPRNTVVRAVLLAAAAAGRGDSGAERVVDEALGSARARGFLNTVIVAAPQLADYLLARPALRTASYAEDFLAGASALGAAEPSAGRDAAPLTPAERRVLELMRTNDYVQIASVLYISRNTVKTHVRSIYQKLGVASRSAAVERAADLRLL
jgi:LuxR family transcriptional regulator, maltose regulon positive regulatory protein